MSVTVVQTRGTAERAAIRALVDARGRAFAVAFFKDVGETLIAQFYWGRPVTEAEFEQVRKFLKERLTLT